MLKTIFSMIVLVTCSAQSLPAAWSTPVNISDLGIVGAPEQAEVSMDNSNGTAVAIWRNSLASTIQVAIKPFGKNWSAPTTISTPGDDVNEPDVAMSSNGNAIAVWTDITLGVIQASYYTAKTNSWSAPVTISSPPTGSNSVRPNVTIDSKGNAIVIWQETIGDVNVRRFVHGTWLSIITLGTNFSSIGPPPISVHQVEVDAVGNAVAIFTGFDGANNRVQYATYTVSTNTWFVSSFITTPGSEGIGTDVAVNSAGNAVLYWQILPLVGNAIAQAGTLDFVQGAWTTPAVQTISLPTDFAITTSVSNDAAGNAVATWYNGNDETILVSSFTKSANNWSTEQIISDTVSVNVNPFVSLNSKGDAIVVWMNISTLTVQAATRSFGKKWSAPQNISPVGQVFFDDFPKVSYDDGVAVWGNQTLGAVQSATWSIANRPRKFHGKLFKKDHLKHNKKYCLFTSWGKPHHTSVASYKIYEDGKVKHTIGSKRQHFKKFVTSKKHLDRRYKISTVNASGIESTKKKLEVKVHE